MKMLMAAQGLSKGPDRKMAGLAAKPSASTASAAVDRAGVIAVELVSSSQ